MHVLASTSTTVPAALIVPIVITVLVAVMIIAVVRGRVRRGDPVLVITYAEGSPYRQIVLEVDEPRLTAARLLNRLVAR